MVVKKRERKTPPDLAELDEFISAGGTLQEETSPAATTPAPTPASASPSREPQPSRARAASKPKDVPGWVQRAQTEKKTEGQPLRYNRSQAKLLAHAKEVEGRDYSKILADLIWPALEERYGKDVPL